MTKKATLGLVALISSISLFYLFVLPWVIKTTEGKGVEWEVFSPEKFIEAKNNKESIVVDFFADWCMPCHELERYTYTHNDVIAALEPFRKFQVDVTEMNDPATVQLIEQYGVEGVPTILFLDPSGQEYPESRIRVLFHPRSFWRLSIGFYLPPLKRFSLDKIKIMIIIPV